MINGHDAPAAICNNDATQPNSNCASCTVIQGRQTWQGLPYYYVAVHCHLSMQQLLIQLTCSNAISCHTLNYSSAAAQLQTCTLSE
jgi:hypothetical protein